MTMDILLHGVDTLVLNGFYTDGDGRPVKRDLDSSLEVHLEDWKKQAQAVHDALPVPWTFDGASLLMQPDGGRKQWRWRLTCPALTVLVSTGRWNSGVLQVVCASQYLWSRRSLDDALIEVHRFLEEVCGVSLHLQPSEIHLCVDVAGWDSLAHLDRQRDFVTRSRKRSAHHSPDWSYDATMDQHSYGLVETGVDFSLHGAMSCAIYDKTREITLSGKDWFEDLWRLHGWDASTQRSVWRVECRFKREALHEVQHETFHGIEDAYDLSDRLPLLWAYAVGQVGGGEDGLPDGWLRCVTPNGDTNRARWPTRPEWEVIQGAFQRQATRPGEVGKIIRKRHEQRNVEKAIEAIYGYLTSLAAWKGGELAEDGIDSSVLLHYLAEMLPGYEERTDKEFSEEVRRKRVKLGLQVTENSAFKR
jgi:hypothetical protein